MSQLSSFLAKQKAKAPPPIDSESELTVPELELIEVNHVAEKAADKLIAKLGKAGSLYARLEEQEAIERAKHESVAALDSNENQLENDELDSDGSAEDLPEELESIRNYYDETSYDDESSREDEEGYYRPLIPDEAEAGLRNQSLVLDESQVAAIDSMLNEQYSCLIGAAGSGKTTCTKELIHRLLYDPDSTFRIKKSGNNFNIAFIAFTGMAVQVLKSVLPSWLHDSCQTIHMVLEYAPTKKVVIDLKTGLPKESMIFEPRRNENNRLFEDLLIIDESSMLGIELWENIRKACKPGTRIVMIGDLNQLPPIIGQPIFAYTLGHWYVSELTHIHRQTGAAGKIVEVAHAVLSGNVSTFKESLDKKEMNPEWRVIAGMIDQKPEKAAAQILNTANGLRRAKFPDGTQVYDPMRDRIMTTGNGYGESGDRASDLVQQSPLNDQLALIFQPPTDESPRYLIDAGRVVRHFANGNRVMASKNEAPNSQRVTNGMTGIIKLIVRNDEYTGNKHRFGPEKEVGEYIRATLGLTQTQQMSGQLTEAQMTQIMEEDFTIDMDGLAEGIAERLAKSDSDEAVEKADGKNWASHTIVVEFVNGATREFWSKQQVESLQLAYASTVAKCQGSQFPTAIIVVHHAQKQALCREWLYTAVTRAQGHVIILYTEFGLRQALGKQKIKGNTIQEKVKRYLEYFQGVDTPMGGVMRRNVNLYIEE